MIQCIDADCVADVYKKKYSWINQKAMRQTDNFGSVEIGQLGDGSFAKIQCELIGEARYITLSLSVRESTNLQISQIW